MNNPYGISELILWCYELLTIWTVYPRATGRTKLSLVSSNSEKQDMQVFLLYLLHVREHNLKKFFIYLWKWYIRLAPFIKEAWSNTLEHCCLQKMIWTDSEVLFIQFISLLSLTGLKCISLFHCCSKIV